MRVESTIGTGVAVSALLLAHSVPNGLLGPIAGAVSDRMDQRTLMVATDIGRAVVFIVLAATLPPFVALVALMTLAAVFETGFRPAGRSAIPALVERSELMAANAWLVSALNIGVAVGPLIGGLLVASIGVSGALYANAGTFLFSAALLARLPSLPAETVEGVRPTFLTTVREGLSFARRDPMMRAVIVGLVLGVAAGGLDNVALVFMARRVFDVGATGYGVLASAFGIGMITASLLLVRSHRLTSSALFVLGWFGTAIGNFGVGVAPVLSLAVAAQLIGGAGNGVGLVGGDTLLQERVPKPMLGRAIGIAGSAPHLGSLIAYAVGGVLVDWVGARATFMVSGTATALVAIAVAVMLKNTRARTV